MISRTLSVLLFCLGLFCLNQQSQSQTMLLLGAGKGAPGTGTCSQATTFLARTSGLSGTETTATTTLICDLVTQGVWSLLDAMYVFATNTTATANLNLVSTSYSITANGSPAFAANGGYTGVDGSTTVFLDTGFNPTTATSPNFTQNAAHISAWSNTNNKTVNAIMGLTGAAAAVPASNIYPFYTDNNAYYRINDNTFSAGITTSDSLGHYLANRSASGTQQGYKNAVNQSVVSVTSGALENGNLYILAQNQSPVGPAVGSARQIMIATIGGSLTSGQVTNLCHEENLYLTSVAGLSAGTC